MIARQAALLMLVLSLIGGACYGLSRLMLPPQQRHATMASAPPGSLLQLSPAERAERIAKVFRE